MTENNELKFYSPGYSDVVPIMTIHDDGRITLRYDAQPTEAAASCIEGQTDALKIARDAYKKAKEQRK